MFLKFHINPPYIVYVVNCILTHFLFFREYTLILSRPTALSSILFL